jgi:hypothetical protein
VQKINLSGGTGGTSGQTTYTAPNGVIVTSSAPVYNSSNYYYMSYLFNNTITTAQTQYTSYWLTNSSGNQTLTFDFQKLLPLSIVQINVYPRSRDDASSNYRILVSNDGTVWIEIVPWVTTSTSTPYGTKFTHSVNITQRYVRFELTQNGSYGVCLSEIEFYKASVNFVTPDKINIDDLITTKIVFKRNNVILGTINNPIVNQNYSILDYVSGLNYKDVLVVEGYDSNNNLINSMTLNVKEDFTGKQGILTTISSIDTKDWDSINSIQAMVNVIDLFIDFENNNYLSYFKGDWVRVSTSPYGGKYCYRNADIGDNQTSQTQITIYTPSNSLLSFWYRVSSESGYDELWFYIDGNEKLGGKSGTIGWTQVSYELPEGTHNLVWKYTKDGSVSSGEDSVYIDNLSISNIKSPDPQFILSNDNKQTWYTYQNNQFIPVTNPTVDIFTQGITDLSTLPPLTKQNFLTDRLDIMVGLKNNSINENPVFKGINISYKLNDYIINTYSKTDTVNITNSEYIYQPNIIDSVYKFNFTINGDGYKVFFSKDGGNTWLTYNGIDFIEGGGGNYIWEINNLSQELLMQFLPISNFRLKFEPIDSSAVLNSITINYSVKTNSILPSDAKEALLPVPPQYFRNVLQVDNTYTLKLEEGLSFDDANKDYDFYTTPTKVKLRPLDMGTVIGNKWSVVQAFEVINSHENQDYDIELKVAYNNEEAIIKDNTALLNDTDLDSEKTIVEFSLTQDPFELIYPVKFRLDRNSKQVVYFKIKPTIVTEGTKTFQIRLTATPL